MVTCPAGHASASEDFCDVCGHLIGAVPSLAPGGAAAGEPGAGAAASAAPGPGEPCPRCGAPRAGKFCESCGHDFTAVSPSPPGPAVPRPAPSPPGPVPPPPRPAPQAVPPQAVPPQAVPPQTVRAQAVSSPPAPAPSVPSASGEWSAVVTADRAYYDAVQAAGGPDAAGIAFPAYFPQRRFRLTGAEVRIGRHSASSGINLEIDLAVPPADPGVSRLHAVLLKSPDGSWSLVDPGSANGTAVNGSEIPPGQAVPLRDGDRIHLGAWTELRIVRGG